MPLTLCFHFITLEIECEEPQVLSWLTQTYTLHKTDSTPASRAVTLTVQLVRRSSENIMTVDAPENAIFTGYSMGLWPCYFKDGVFFTQKPSPQGLSLTYDVQGSRIRCILDDVYFEDSTVFLHLFFRVLLRSFIFQFNGLIPLHGAAVARDGEGILLLGDKGAGKSTLSLAMARQGFSVVADDAPFLSLVEQRAVLFSSLDTPRITRESLALLPEYADSLSPEADMLGKHALLADHMPKTFFEPGPVPVHTLVFLQRREGQTFSMDRLKPGDALRILLAEYAMAFQNPDLLCADPRFAEISRFSFEAVSQLVADASEIYTLSHDNTLPETLVRHLAP